jgi:hypothetical protein
MARLQILDRGSIDPPVCEETVKHAGRVTHRKLADTPHLSAQVMKLTVLASPYLSANFRD